MVIIQLLQLFHLVNYQKYEILVNGKTANNSSTVSSYTFKLFHKMFTKLYFYRKIEYNPIDGVMLKEYNYQLVGV